jgi:signal transduction histidine kinase
LRAAYTYGIVWRGADMKFSRRLRIIYFSVLLLVWLALLWHDPWYELLSFSAFAQILGYLPWRAALAVSGIGVLLVHVPPGIREGGVSINHVVFGLVAMVVLTAVVLSLRAVTEQSIRLQRLMRELESTRAEVARTAYHAGTLEERHRLAKDLHDTLAQTLTSIVMMLEAFHGKLDSKSNVSPHVQNALKAAREGLRETRRVVWALRPEALESGNLPTAINRVVSQFGVETGLQVHAVTTGEPHRLTDELEITLLRAVQEGLANVRRHARANNVTVTLSYIDERVALDIWDDGEGFDPAKTPPRPDRTSGLGLLSMRERIEALQGTLSIESTLGQGSSIAIELPTKPRPDQSPLLEDQAR